jgi:hypothetical protein
MDHITKLENYKKATDSARAESQRRANGYLVDKTTREKVDTDLKEQGRDADAILAESFVSSLAPLEAIERMLASAELRRNNALREIDRRRSALGRVLRQMSDHIIEADGPPMRPAHR